MDQATRYNAYRRRLSHLDPASGLFRTHTLPVAVGAIDTDVLFAETIRNAPVTVLLEYFADAGLVTVRLGGPAEARLEIDAVPNGSFARVGGANAGDFLQINMVPCHVVVGKVNRFIVAANPGTGRIQFWVNGFLIGDEQTVNGSFGGPWAGIADGAITVNGQSYVTKLAVFAKQIPQHFRG